MFKGGNQRELARAKNLKKQQAAAKGKAKESGMDKTKRMERLVPIVHYITDIAYLIIIISNSYRQSFFQSLTQWHPMSFLNS